MSEENKNRYDQYIDNLESKSDQFIQEIEQKAHNLKAESPNPHDLAIRVKENLSEEFSVFVYDNSMTYYISGIDKGQLNYKASKKTRELCRKLTEYPLEYSKSLFQD